MNNKLAKKMRKFVKQTMAKEAKWCVYNTNVVKRPVVLNAMGDIGESITEVKSLVEGCGRQRYKKLKLQYKGV